MRRMVLLAAAVAVLAACSGTVSSAQPPPPSASPAATATAHCGLERWPVKTGTDQDASKVDLGTVVPATIAQLAATAPPALPLPQDTRIPPVEFTVYRVQATLTGFKQEADSDFHLILTQVVQTSTGQKTYTMIAEIPDPACVGPGSPFLPGITAARAAFTQRYTPSDLSFTHVSVPVTVTGVGFFDPEHGQTGGAVLQGGQVTIELHPVLDFKFGP